MSLSTAESAAILEFARVYEDSKAALLNPVVEETAKQVNEVLAEVAPPLIINTEDLLRSNFFDEVGDTPESAQIALYMSYVDKILRGRRERINFIIRGISRKGLSIVWPPDRKTVLQSIWPATSKDELLGIVSHLPDEAFNELIAEIILDFMRNNRQFPQLKKVRRKGTKTIVNDRVRTSGRFAIDFDELKGVLTLTPSPKDQFQGDLIDEVKEHWAALKKHHETDPANDFFEERLIYLGINPNNLREIAFKFTFPNNRLDAVLKAIQDPQDPNHAAILALEEEKIWVLAMGLKPRSKSTTSTALASQTESWDAFPTLRDAVSGTANWAFVRGTMTKPSPDHPQAVQRFLGDIESRYPQSGWTAWVGRATAYLSTPWKVPAHSVHHAQTVHQVLLDLARLDSAITTAEKSGLNPEVVAHLKATAIAARAALPAWLKPIEFAIQFPEVAVISSFNEFPTLLRNMIANTLTMEGRKIEKTARDHQLRIQAEQTVEQITARASEILNPNKP